MTCTACHNPIPNDKLVCPRCAAEKGYQALLQYQMDPLRRIYAGQGELVTRTSGTMRHVQMFADDRAFCGRPVDASYRKGWMAWSEEALAAICPVCRQHLVELMEKACRE